MGRRLRVILHLASLQRTVSARPFPTVRALYKERFLSPIVRNIDTDARAGPALTEFRHLANILFDLQ